MTLAVAALMTRRNLHRPLSQLFSADSRRRLHLPAADSDNANGIAAARCSPARLVRMPRLLPRQAPAHPPRPARASRRAAPRHRRRRRAPALAPRPSPRARAAAAAQRLHAHLSVAGSAAARCDRLCSGGKPRAGDLACQRARDREDDVALANAHPAPLHERLRLQDTGARLYARVDCKSRRRQLSALPRV